MSDPVTDRQVDQPLTVRPDRHAHPRQRPQRALPARRRRRAHRRPGPGPAPPARQPRVRPRPVGLDGRPEQARAREAGGRRGDPPARGRGPVRGRDLRRPGRGRHRRRRSRPRRARRVPPTAARDASRPAAARTSTAAGSPAASRSRRGLAAEGVNRVLLLTDGLANVGITDHDGAPAARRATSGDRGVTTSTFGVGTDFDEALLQGMADAGGGHFYFIGDVAQMRDHITSEVGETLEVVAREVVLELVAARSASGSTPLSPFRVEQARRPRPGLPRRHGLGPGAVDRRCGSRSTSARSAARSASPSGSTRPRRRVRPRPTRRSRRSRSRWRYADHAANDAQPRDRDGRSRRRPPVRRARPPGGRPRSTARAATTRPRKALDGVRRRVAAYAGQDPELQGIVARARASRSPPTRPPMPEMARKQRALRGEPRLRMRTPDGKSQKRS